MNGERAVVDGPLVLAAGSLLDADADTLLTAAAEAGFDGIGLRLSGEHRLTEAEATTLRRRAERLGVAVHDAEVHRISASPDPDDIELLLQAASAVGAAKVLIVSDLPDLADTAPVLAGVAERCRRRGLQPAIEYMAWTTPSDPEAARSLAVETGCTVVVDVLHHRRIGAPASALDAIVADGVLGWVQVCDGPVEAPADLVNEARHGRLPPGCGELEVDDLLARVPGGTPIAVEVQSDHLMATTDPAGRARLLAGATRKLLRAAGSPP